MRDLARATSAGVQFAVLLATVGCQLGQADLVTRSPDLAPAIGTPPEPDAADLGASGPAAPDGENLDQSVPPRDSRESERLDVSLAADGRDSPGETRGEAATAILDVLCGGEAGAECAGPRLVLDENFEDGAAGWMSTGIIWSVVDDPSGTEPNSVLAPTAPAASSVYFSSGAWQDMTVQARVRVMSFGPSSSANRAELYARYQDPGHFYAIGLSAERRLGLRCNSRSLGAAVDVSVAESEWHVLAIRVSGPAESVSLEGYLDGRLVLAAMDGDDSLASAVGTVGVGIYGETLAAFDDIEVSSP